MGHTTPDQPNPPNPDERDDDSPAPGIRSDGRAGGASRVGGTSGSSGGSGGGGGKSAFDRASPYRILGIGVELGAVIGGMTFAGYLVDYKFDTQPWGAFFGATLGITVGCHNTIKEVFRMQKRK